MTGGPSRFTQDGPSRLPGALIAVALKALAIILVAVLAGGCHRRAAEGTISSLIPSIQAKTPATGTYHTVAQDETLSAIAAKYKVDLQILAEVNNLKPPYTIAEGSRLFIPGTASVKRDNSPVDDSEQASKVELFSGLLAWPVQGPLISPFGVREGVQHNGIAIRAPSGSPVRSAADGKVGHVGAIPGYGNVILIEHANRLVTVYAHLQHIRCEAGESVKQGQVIGTAGSSGRADTSSLYFEVRSRSQPRNPLFFLPQQEPSNTHLTSE